MRKWLRHYLPDHGAIRHNRWLAPFANTLLHPRLWHVNRRSAAGGFAVGLFCGLIPGPFQMLGAAIGAVALRVNLPIALLTTVYTNPLTIVPLYVVAYAIGGWLVGGNGHFVAPPERGDTGLADWISSLLDWMLGLGTPLAVGVLALATALAATGYLAARMAWRLWLVRRWRQRKR